MILMSFRYEPYLLPEGFSPTEYDAICGWARQNFGHPGNRRLREIISQNVPVYKRAKTKSDKGKVIIDLCKQLIEASPTRTGFVKLDPKSGRWFFIGYEKSKDKIGHALRKSAQFQAKRSKRSAAAAAEKSSEDVGQIAQRRLPQHQQDQELPRHLPQGQAAFPASPITGESSREDTSSDEDKHRSLLYETDTRQTMSPSHGVPLRQSSIPGGASLEPPLPLPASLPLQRREDGDAERTSQVLRFLIGGPSNIAATSASSTRAEASAAVSSDHLVGNSDGSSGGEQSKASSKTSSLIFKTFMGSSPTESPIRRSMFDSPLKPAPSSSRMEGTIQSTDGAQSNMAIPLPLSSNLGGPESEYHGGQEGERNDNHGRITSLTPHERSSTNLSSPTNPHHAAGTHHPPPSYPPNYYYPPPYVPSHPSGYLYYPVPVPYPPVGAYQPPAGVYPPPTPYYYPSQSTEHALPPPQQYQRMPPSALRREPNYPSRHQKGDEEEPEQVPPGRRNPSAKKGPPS